MASGWCRAAFRQTIFKSKPSTVFGGAFRNLAFQFPQSSLISYQGLHLDVLSEPSDFLSLPFLSFLRLGALRQVRQLASSATCHEKYLTRISIVDTTTERYLPLMFSNYHIRGLLLISIQRSIKYAILLEVAFNEATSTSESVGDKFKILARNQGSR